MVVSARVHIVVLMIMMENCVMRGWPRGNWKVVIMHMVMGLLLILMMGWRRIVIKEQVRLVSQFDGRGVVGIGVSLHHFQIHVCFIVIVLITVTLDDRGARVVRRIFHGYGAGRICPAARAYFSIDTDWS